MTKPEYEYHMNKELLSTIKEEARKKAENDLRFKITTLKGRIDRNKESIDMRSKQLIELQTDYNRDCTELNISEQMLARIEKEGMNL